MTQKKVDNFKLLNEEQNQDLMEPATQSVAHKAGITQELTGNVHHGMKQVCRCGTQELVLTSSLGDSQVHHSLESTILYYYIGDLELGFVYHTIS